MMKSSYHEESAGRTPRSTNNNALPLRDSLDEEAVHGAVQDSPHVKKYDKALVDVITRNVLAQLQVGGVVADGHAESKYHPSSSATSQQTPDPRPATAQQDMPAERLPSATRYNVPGSPTSPVSSHSQLHGRYTPPSPNRYDSSSQRSLSPEVSGSEAASSYAGKDAKTGGTNGRRDSRSSSGSYPDDATASRQRHRPVRIPSSVEETSLEKAWQPLFEDGKPTARLGQFLRGLAKHLIEDCEPNHSLVVTPGKLADFFSVTKLKIEMYPWQDAFGGKMTNNALSKLFMTLRCQHHLVQFKDYEAPCIPGLTPQGFQIFMTMLIQAHPDQEFQRLDKAAREMPISNPDPPGERFPKQLTRRLFPAGGDTQQQQRLTAALGDLNVKLNHSNPLPPPPPTQPPTSASQTPSMPERERNPYPSYCGVSSSAIDDDDLRSTTAPIPIERERKPYVAREGSGKVHEEPNSIPGSFRVDPVFRSNRSNSTLPMPATFSQPSSQPSNLSASIPSSIPNSMPRSHRMSMNGTGQHYALSPGSAGAFRHSPNVFTRSDGANIGDVPSQYYASNIRDHEEDMLQRRDSRRQYRRQNAEDELSRAYSARAAPASTHAQQPGFVYPGHGGTDGYGSYSGHPPPPPPTSRY